MSKEIADTLIDIVNETHGTTCAVQKVEAVLFDILEVLKRIEENLKQE